MAATPAKIRLVDASPTLIEEVSGESLAAHP